MKTWSLGKKLFLSGVMVGLLVPVLGLVTYGKLSNLNRLNEEISLSNLPKTKVLGEIVYKFRNIRLQIRTVPVRNLSRQEMSFYVDLTKTAIEDFHAAMKVYEGMLDSESERAQFKALKESSDDFIAFGGRLIDLANKGDDASIDDIAKQVADICPAKAKVVEDSISSLIEFQATEAKERVQLAQAESRSLVVMLLSGSVLGLLLAVGLMTGVGRSIYASLKSISSSLADSTVQLGDAATAVNANSGQVSTSASEQAAALQESVATMDQIRSMIQKTSENSEKSNTTAKASFDQAKVGQDQVGQLISGIETIKTSIGELLRVVEVSNGEMTRILDIFQQIESKTKVINEIVFQTKLLSFNASVEAARAGESGKGFAVVAEEVGNLAVLSGNASLEISSLLTESLGAVEKIISETKARVQVQAENSEKRVEDGIELAKSAGASLSEIVESANRLSSMVSEISAASREQSAGVNEMMKAIHRMNELTQENAAVSQASAQSSDSLLNLSEALKTYVTSLNVMIDGANAAHEASRAQGTTADLHAHGAARSSEHTKQRRAS